MRALILLAMGLCLIGLPAAAQPKSAGAPDAQVIDDLVAASRVLADLGVVDGFGRGQVMRPWELWKRKAVKPE